MQDTHNQVLLKVVEAILADTQMRSMLTDLDMLDHIAKIVEKRKLTIGLTDCTTGLRYE